MGRGDATGANQIGRITPDGQITEFAVPTANSRPEFITAGPDGNIWFTEPGSARMGEFVLNASATPAAVAAPAASAALAPATPSATGVTQLAGSALESLPPSAVNQQPTGVNAVTPRETRHAHAGADIMRHHHKAHRAEAADAAELADPLGEAQSA